MEPSIKGTKLDGKHIRDIQLVMRRGEQNQDEIRVTFAASADPNQLWDKMRSVARIISMTADGDPHLPIDSLKDGERIDSSSGALTLSEDGVGELRQRHTLTGSDIGVTIRPITTKHLPNVAAKLVRAMHYEGVITETELKKAYKELALPPRNLPPQGGSIIGR